MEKLMFINIGQHFTSFYSLFLFRFWKIKIYIKEIIINEYKQENIQIVLRQFYGQLVLVQLWDTRKEGKMDDLIKVC